VLGVPPGGRSPALAVFRSSLEGSITHQIEAAERGKRASAASYEPQPAPGSIALHPDCLLPNGRSGREQFQQCLFGMADRRQVPEHVSSSSPGT
jgi:hypothetical protein